MLNRLLIISLLIIVISETALLILNWQNIMIRAYTIPSTFTINSTTGLVILMLVAHDAYAKVIITLTNLPLSNATLTIYLSNGTNITLRPGSTIRLTYLFTPSSYLAYPECSGGVVSLPNASAMAYSLNSLSNPFIIYESTFNSGLLRLTSFNLTLAVSSILRDMSPCGTGTYLLILTNGNNAMVMVQVSRVVFVI